jgi:hypothetical protein
MTACARSFLSDTSRIAAGAISLVLCDGFLVRCLRPLVSRSSSSIAAIDAIVELILSRVDNNVATDLGLTGQDVTLGLILLGERILQPPCSHSRRGA